MSWAWFSRYNSILDVGYNLGFVHNAASAYKCQPAGVIARSTSFKYCNSVNKCYYLCSQTRLSVGECDCALAAGLRHFWLKYRSLGWFKCPHQQRHLPTFYWSSSSPFIHCINFSRYHWKRNRYLHFPKNGVQIAKVVCHGPVRVELGRHRLSFCFEFSFRRDWHGNGVSENSWITTSCVCWFSL